MVGIRSGGFDSINGEWDRTKWLTNDTNEEIWMMNSHDKVDLELTDLGVNNENQVP